MKIGADNMKAAAKCTVTKSKRNMKKGVNIEPCDCTLFSCVTSGITQIDISEKNITVSLRTADLLTVMNAANQKYMELRENEKGTTVVE